MNRPILVGAFLVAATAALGAQQASQSNPYQGVSNPPPDDTIVTTTAPEAKPPAGHRLKAKTPAPAPAPQQPTGQFAGQLSQQGAEQPAPDAATGPSTVSPALQAGTTYAGQVDGTDSGIVKVAPQPYAAPPQVRPALETRNYAPDADGDIVHPQPLPPDTLGAGTEIHVKLMNDLSSSMSEQGEPFRSRVAYDVWQGDKVLIPAGAEIDGKVVDASSGRFAGRGSLLLRPETMILKDGSRYELHAMVADTMGSNTHVESEGVIKPDPSLKRDGIEYGGGVGAGVVAGAYLGGPVGALAGGLIGAGVVTAHLLVNHPQAHLDEGSELVLSLTQPMHLSRADVPQN
jgi:type IV secretory pathway VirB10-like protein